MAHYFLPTSVYVCYTADGTVFLDVNNNRYFGLDAQHTRILNEMLNSDGNSAECAALASDLTQKGLITKEPEVARTFAPTSVELPNAPLIDSILEKKPQIRLSHIVAFLTSCVAIGIGLRFGSLKRVISKFEARKASVVNHGFNIEDAQELVRVFWYLRPFFYAARNKCLYDSLVLADFLGRHELYPTCVFGVRTLPFAAHCWVQADRFVINGSPGFVGSYVPILAV